MARIALALAAATSLAVRPADAQTNGLVARADTLLIAGRIFSAESLYYIAVRRAPRDPIARLALGRYLAQRGALKVGAVLMEEARYFGGDAAQIAVDLAPVYGRLGEYNHLAALPSSVVPYGERLRAEYLRDNPPGVSGPDSASVPYLVNDSQLLGRVALRVGTDTVIATIDARVEGLVLDTAWARRSEIRRFGARSTPARDALAVTPQVALGPYTLTNVPTRFAAQRGAARATIGLDLLGELAPSFDPRNARMVLRASGRIPESFPGARIATLTNDRGVYVVKGETIFPLGHPDVQRYFRNSRWTLDPRRGEVVVDSVGPPSGM
ncbi:MAG: tetratricopeptide repeat protein [Gemmatimonadaceae bacterium]